MKSIWGERLVGLDESPTTSEEDPVENNKYSVNLPKYFDLSGYRTDAPQRIMDLYKSIIIPGAFEVNGSIFIEGGQLKSRHDDDAFAEYKLFKGENKLDHNDENMTNTLDPHVQIVSQGVIINSNVFLSDAQWHTMVMFDDQMFCCAVCQVYCVRSACEEHIKTSSHLCNLNSHKPLKKFDLSIARKIDMITHCGVCNEIFITEDFEIHENSKKHEENLLTAINKVSDLMYDSDITCDYTERIVHTSDRNTDSFLNNMLNDDTNMSNDVLDSDRAPRNNGEYPVDANVINNNHICIYEVYSQNEEDDIEEEIVEEDSTEELEEYSLPCQGISYASMASKPSVTVPKFMKIDLGTRALRVKYESWHMIIKIASNRYYCMVCNMNDLIRFKNQHCMTCDHIEKLARCTVIRAFDDYLIRKVNDKLYHCGYCNNLRYLDQMEDHIEYSHPKKNRNYNVEDAGIPLKKKKTVVKTNKEQKKMEPVKNAVVNKNVAHKMELEDPDMLELEDPDMLAQNIHPHFDIFGDIHLSPFGCMLTIPALHFNLICQLEENNYCILCNKICENVKTHVKDLEHVTFMTMAPYIQKFKDNLTRAIRGNFHCSLCNDLIAIDEIYNHNMDQKHTDALATAMGIKRSHRLDKAPRKITKTLGNIASINQTRALQNTQLPSAKHLQSPSTSPGKLPGDDLTQVSNATSTRIQKHVQSENVLKSSSSSLTNDLTAHNITDGISAQNDAHNIFVEAILKYTRGELPVTVLSDDGQNLRHFQKKTQHFQNISIPTVLEVNLPPPKDLSKSLHPPKSVKNFPFTSPNVGVENFPLTSPNVPMFDSMFPPLPPVNNQHLNQLSIEEPLNYTHGPTSSPFSQLSPNNTPTLLSPNEQKLTLKDIHYEYSPKQGMERKTLIITDTVKSSDDHSELRIDRIHSGTDLFRRDNEHSRSANDHSRRDSEHSITGNDKSRRSSENGKTVDDQTSRSSVDRNNVFDSIVIGNLSEEEDFKEFDYDEMVLVKFKTTYIKITKIAYNTLVFMDNGVRFCFVCSSKVYSHQLQKHMESRKHMEFLADSKFLDKYGVQLFRQMYVKYHCAICNVLMTRKDCKLHLDWQLHMDAYDAAHLLLNKKNRKHLKSGLKEYSVGTQKEAIFMNVKEPTYRVRASYRIGHNLDNNDAAVNEPTDGFEGIGAGDRKNKMVIQNNVVMKIPFEHWHGITATNTHSRCILCQLELRDHEVGAHVESEYHAVSLGITFDSTHAPALIRKINASSVNCMTCNLELPNAEELVAEHLAGRRHQHHRDAIVRDTLHSHSYADCYTEYLHV